MVEAAAGAHRRLLHAAQARQRLAGVEDARLAVRGAHVPAGQRGDAGAVAQEVERDALAGEDRTQASRDLAELGARLDRVTVVDAPA